MNTGVRFLRTNYDGLSSVIVLLNPTQIWPVVHNQFLVKGLMHSLFNITNFMEANFSDATNYRVGLCLNKVEGEKFSLYEAFCLLDSQQQVSGIDSD